MILYNLQGLQTRNDLNKVRFPIDFPAFCWIFIAFSFDFH